VFDAVLVGTTGDDGIPRALSEVHPSIPETYVPGEAFEIALNVAPTEVVRAWTLEQRVPAEWSVDFISDSGVHDPVTGKVKWGPFTDEPAFGRELSLILTPPPSADGEVDLGGVAQFDADDLTFTGVSRRFRLHEVSAATRELPDEFQGGVPVPVILVVTPRDGIEAMAIEDEPPVGWTVVPGSVTEGGIVDVRSGRVKWGPFIGTEATPRELAYEILPPVDALGVARFAGRGVYGSVSAPIGGDDTILGLIGRIHRDAPARFTPGEEFEIQLDADPSALTEAFAIEEALPPDWTFLSATEGGVFDPVTRKVKWGPFPDSTQRTLSLIAIPPATGDRTAALRGGGVFNREAVDTTGIDEAVRNSPPIAIPDSAGRNPGEVFKVSAIKLVLNDSDPDGDLPVVVAVSPFSANGAPVELEWPWIYYSPLPGPDIPDSFEYTIDDGFGGRSTATVHIVINPPPPPSQNIIRIETLPGGAKRVVFPGVPGFVYHIDVSEDLVTWTHLADRTCGPNGQFEYVDEDAPLYPTRYYRATWP
jgi:hypothetical protein